MKDEKVINLKAVKALKNPIVAICQQLDNHNTLIQHYNNDINMLLRSSVKDKQRIKHLVNGVQVLIWTQIITWLVLGGVIVALFRHSHSLTSLL